jgi:hypothetical protein
MPRKRKKEKKTITGRVFTFLKSARETTNEKATTKTANKILGNART